MVQLEDRILIEEREGEIIGNYFRLALGAVYTLGIPIISLTRYAAGLKGLPPLTFVFPALLFLWALGLYAFLKSNSILPAWFKYTVTTVDMVIVSLAALVSMGPQQISGIFSIQILFYYVLILLGAFRYSPACALYSGVSAGAALGIVLFIRSNFLDAARQAAREAGRARITIPPYNDIFRIIFCVIIGAIIYMVSRRHIELLKNMLKVEAEAAEEAAKTVTRTKGIAKTIDGAALEILTSSQEISTTANQQAASVQEIESTIKENAAIAGDIAEKTGSVATIASKMEEDVIRGFSVLESNVEKMADIKLKNDGVIGGIVSLGNKIAKIRDIIKDINTITDQTKVIAFNASLEAASAGEKGKRFSVVASEVNRLADDIAVLTKQIRDQIENIQDSSSSLIISSEEGADKITEGNRLIKDLEDIFKEIRYGAEITSNQAQTITVSTQKQQKSIEQINVAIREISTGLSMFIHSTEHAKTSSEELNKLSGELADVLNEKA